MKYQWKWNWYWWQLRWPVMTMMKIDGDIDQSVMMTHYHQWWWFWPINWYKFDSDDIQWYSLMTYPVNASWYWLKMTIDDWANEVLWPQWPRWWPLILMMVTPHSWWWWKSWPIDWPTIVDPMILFCYSIVSHWPLRWWWWLTLFLTGDDRFPREGDAGDEEVMMMILIVWLVLLINGQPWLKAAFNDDRLMSHWQWWH